MTAHFDVAPTGECCDNCVRTACGVEQPPSNIPATEAVPSTSTATATSTVHPTNSDNADTSPPSVPSTTSLERLEPATRRGDHRKAAFIALAKWRFKTLNERYLNAPWGQSGLMSDTVLNAFTASRRWKEVADVVDSPAQRWLWLSRHGLEVLAVLKKVDDRVEAEKQAKANEKKRELAERQAVKKAEAEKKAHEKALEKARMQAEKDAEKARVQGERDAVKEARRIEQEEKRVQRERENAARQAERDQKKADAAAKKAQREEDKVLRWIRGRVREVRDELERQMKDKRKVLDDEGTNRARQVIATTRICGRADNPEEAQVSIYALCGPGFSTADLNRPVYTIQSSSSPCAFDICQATIFCINTPARKSQCTGK